MSQQQKFIGLPLIGLVFLSALIGLYLFASKRFSKHAPAAVVKHSVETSPEDALKYWTENRMRSAKPAPMPHVDKPAKRKRKSRRSKPHSEPHQN